MLDLMIMTESAAFCACQQDPSRASDAQSHRMKSIFGTLSLLPWASILEYLKVSEKLAT
jgi:hypothetical protein